MAGPRRMPVGRPVSAAGEPDRDGHLLPDGAGRSSGGRYSGRRLCRAVDRLLLAHPLAAERHCGRTQTLTCGRVRRRQSTIWHALCRRMEMRSVCRFWGSPDPVPEKAWQAAMPFLPFMRRFAFRGWLCATPHGRTTAGDSPGNLCPGGLPPEEFRQNDDRRNRAAGACVGTGGKQAAPSAESSPGNGAASHPGPDSRGGTAASCLCA